MTNACEVPTVVEHAFTKLTLDIEGLQDRSCTILAPNDARSEADPEEDDPCQDPGLVPALPLAIWESVCWELIQLRAASQATSLMLVVPGFAQHLRGNDALREAALMQRLGPSKLLSAMLRAAMWGDLPLLQQLASKVQISEQQGVMPRRGPGGSSPQHHNCLDDDADQEETAPACHTKNEGSAAGADSGTETQKGAQRWQPVCPSTGIDRQELGLGQDQGFGFLQHDWANLDLPTRLLCAAAAHGQDSVCRWLLAPARGAPASHKHVQSGVADAAGSVVLRVAAACGKTEVCRVMLQHGARANARWDEALRMAAERGHLDVCRLLLGPEAGAHRTDVAGGKGWSALVGAAYGGQVEVCRLLLRSGMHADAAHSAALCAATEQGHAVVCALLKGPEAGRHRANLRAAGGGSRKVSRDKRWRQCPWQQVLLLPLQSMQVVVHEGLGVLASGARALLPSARAAYSKVPLTRTSSFGR